jgi:hypothetical protein
MIEMRAFLVFSSSISDISEGVFSPGIFTNKNKTHPHANPKKEATIITPFFVCAFARRSVSRFYE